MINPHDLNRVVLNLGEASVILGRRPLSYHDMRRISLLVRESLKLLPEPVIPGRWQ